MPMPNYMNQYQFPFAGNQMPIQQSQVPVQTQQTTGLVPVPSEEVARNYPVGFGQSVSFKDENLPFIYTKTMGFSQLEPPKFEKYRLIKEGSSDETKSDDKDRKETANMVSELRKEMDDLASKLETLKADNIDTIWKELEQIKNDLSKPIGSFTSKKKKEVISYGDESDS